jgi:hypothetical protein
MPGSVRRQMLLKLQQIWTIRIPLELVGSHRDLALLNLVTDSKLKGGDFVSGGYMTLLVD